MEYEGVGAGDVTITGTYLDKDISDSITINDTSVLSPQWLFFTIRFDDKYKDIWERMYQKHQVESGNWYIFGRGERWIGKNETWEEAEDRIVRDYCKATGHWDLFIWEEVEK